MRVIGGEFRSRRIKTLSGLETRPTPDRLRETLFNVLATVIADSIFLDAYAGSGAVGIEALSRGASRAIFVEKNRAAVEVIRENLSTLGLEKRAEVFTGKTLTVLSAWRRISSSWILRTKKKSSTNPLSPLWVYPRIGW